MNKLFNSLRKSVLPITGMVAVSVFFSACSKFDNENSNTNTPVAALMAFNLAPDKPAVGIGLSGSSLTNMPLDYTNYTGGYKAIFPGTRQVEAYDYSAATPFATTSQTFVANTYYSSFTVGAGGSYKHVVVEDKLTEPDSLPAKNEGFVRYVNGITDSTNAAEVSIANGAKVINGSAAYATVSEFQPVDTGSVTLNVKVGVNATANRTITVEKGKIYTVLLVGTPGSTDPAKGVQIKFIQNGVVTPVTQ